MLHHKKFPIEQRATKKNMETKPMAEIVSQQIGKKPKKNGKRGRKKKRLEPKNVPCTFSNHFWFIVFQQSQQNVCGVRRGVGGWEE